MSDTPRIEELKRRVQSDPASIAFAALAEEYRRAGRYEEAIAACTTGLVRHPSYLSAHVTLGRSLIEVGRFEEARDELEFVLKHAPENLAAIRGLAEIHHRLGDDASDQYNTAANTAREAAALAERQDPTPEPPPARIPVAAAEPMTPAEEFDLAIFAAPPAPAFEPDAVVPLPPAAAAFETEQFTLPPPPPVVFEPAPPPVASATEFDLDIFSIVAPPAPPPPRLEDPALAGLEDFLAAIVRARAEGTNRHSIVH